jgi:hypothetical protein
MLDLSVGVVVPAGFTAFSNELRRMKNFTLGNMFLSSKLNFELSKLSIVTNSTQNGGYPFKAIGWVANLVLLQIFHLSRI